EPVKGKPVIDASPALSMKDTVKNTIKTRQVAFLAANGVAGTALNKMKAALEKEGATVKIIAPKLGEIKTDKGVAMAVDGSFLTQASVFFDAVFIPSGKRSADVLAQEPDAIHFINEAYRHCKVIATEGEGKNVLKQTDIKETEQSKAVNDTGIIIDKSAKEFIQAIAQHRFWEREDKRKVPA
ncbi:MAG: DJ-1/PfpI family protein, partial [Bacteroidota bacterium]